MTGSPLSRETILVVDDDYSIRQLVSTVLEREGYGVLTAQDGLQALAAMREHAGSVALLVTDIIMPRMDGLALCKAFAAEWPGVPRLAMSAHFDDVEAPPDCVVLTKPFTVEFLLVKVRQLLRAGRAAVTPS